MRDYEEEKVCGNCRNIWREGDKYCRYCGAPMDNPSYQIRDFATIYGPMPVERIHVCSKCNYSWKTELMIDKEHFCPQCGATASSEETKEDSSFKSTSTKAGLFSRLLRKGK